MSMENSLKLIAWDTDAIEMSTATMQTKAKVIDLYIEHNVLDYVPLVSNTSRSPYEID